MQSPEPLRVGWHRMVSEMRRHSPTGSARHSVGRVVATKRAVVRRQRSVLGALRGFAWFLLVFVWYGLIR